MASALAGGDCIDDADALRSGGTAGVLGGVVKAPSTLGTFLRSFRWGHVRQLGPGEPGVAGPGLGCRGRSRRRAPLTIDLDFDDLRDLRTCQGGGTPPRLYPARGGITRCWPWLPALADVLMARLREGQANTGRGAGHFLRETVSRVRYAGAKGQLTMRADSGFYTHPVVRVCRQQKVRFSITVRLRQSLRNLIEAIPEADWKPISYWMDGGADVAETVYTPFRTEPDATPVRLVVRRVRPSPGSQLALFASYSYHAFITDRHGRHPGTGGRPSPPRRDRERHPRPQVRRGTQPSPLGRFAANGAWLAVQVMAHNLARWTARLGLGEQIVTTKTLRRRCFSLAGRLTRSARRLTLHLPRRWPWEDQFSRALARLQAIPFPA